MRIKNLSILTFSIASYAMFLLVFAYLVAFLGNLQTTTLAEQIPLLKSLVPVSIDFGRASGTVAIAVAINTGLIALFGLQHSIMARPSFKRAWTKIVPETMERSVYVLIANAVLIFLMWQWRPIPTPALWEADTAFTAAIGWTVMGTGVFILVWATFLIDHFELLGLKQGWAAFRDRPVHHPSFVTPYLYKLVRHPQYLGWLMIFWGTPRMSAGHALFAMGISVYIVIAIQFEERNLRQFIGPAYDDYRERVPPLVPMPGRRLHGS